VALTALWLGAACSLDERALTVHLNAGSAGEQSTMGGRAGSTSAGGALVEPVAGADSGGQAGASGQAGEASAGAPTFENGCADLDHDGRSDCAQTLLKNAQFSSDVADWSPELGATITWDASDLLGASGSGSALVTSSGSMDIDGNVLVAVDQCVRVEPGQVLEFFANARVDAAPEAGSASVTFWFFDAAGCPGDSGSDVYQVPPAVYEPEQTETLTGVTMVPPYINSVRVRLGVIRPFRAESFSARFDNLLLFAR